MVQTYLSLLHRCESLISGFEDDPLQEGIDDLLGDLRALLGIENKEPKDDPDAYEAAARRVGWRQGGDGDGIIYDGTLCDGWKDAASWAGDDEEPDEERQNSATYATWRECCEAEGIPVEGHANV